MQQRIAIGNGIVLLDTPGVLWPNLENKNTGYRLATTGAIKDTAINHEQIAYFAAEFLLKSYPESVKSRFQLEHLPDSEEALLKAIGKSRGCLRSGGQVDMDRVSKILLAELRAGTIGRMSFETPAVMELELIELEAIRAEKKAKKEAKNKKQKGLK
jgi:ribosome biogenesis GTPase A